MTGWKKARIALESLGIVVGIVTLPLPYLVNPFLVVLFGLLLGFELSDKGGSQ